MRLLFTGISLAIAMTGLLSLAGCGTASLDSSDVSDSKRQQFWHFHSRVAASQEQQGHLYQALLHWQILAVAEPHNRQVGAAISRLQGRIDTLTATRVRRGHEALRKGRLKSARSAFLAALVLDPDHGESIVQLRQLVSLEMQQMESRRAASPRPQPSVDEGKAETAGDEDRLSPNPVLSVAPLIQPQPAGLQLFRRLYERRRYRDLIDAVADAEFTAAITEPLASWVLQAYLGVAQSLRRQGRLRDSLDLIDRAQLYSGQVDQNQAFSRKVRRSMAVSLYTQGRQQLQSDINQAIELWQQALAYDPGYSEVRFQLEKAFRRRDNQRHRESVSE